MAFSFCWLSLRSRQLWFRVRHASAPCLLHPLKGDALRKDWNSNACACVHEQSKWGTEAIQNGWDASFCTFSLDVFREWPTPGTGRRGLHIYGDDFWETGTDVWLLLPYARKGRKPGESRVALCSWMSSNGQWRRERHVLLKWNIHLQSSKRVNRLGGAEENSLITAIPDIHMCFPLRYLLSWLLNCTSLLWASTFRVSAC